MKQFETRKMPKSSKLFTCSKCKFKCSKESNYNNHLLTAKHKKYVNETIKNADNVKNEFVCNMCDVRFNSRTTLWRHAKICSQSEESNVELPSLISEPTSVNQTSDNNSYALLTNTILELMKKNDTLTNTIVEMSKQIGNNNNNNNNNNTINNKFNLNVFLNETCKNAMTLTEFVKSMNLSVEDFVNTGELGYVNGISQIMVDRINNMELCDRPLHCTDLKRETVYVKDAEKWEKDEDNDKLRDAVKKVASKNERMRSVWYNETPNIDVLGSDNCEKFFKYSKSALGGVNTEQTRSFQDKIIRNVLKEVIIDKQSIE